MVSWIGFEDKLLYMDNASLRDSYARKLIEETGRKEDVVGHGFIRKYYNIPEGNGKEFEVRDFWNYEKLPEEIATKLQNGEMDDLLEYVSNINLRYIISVALESWKVKAWKIFSKNNPSNDDLCYIIICAPESWKVKAWEILSKNNPSNIDLRCIIRYAPDSWKVKACEILLRNNPDNFGLRCIIRYAPESWKVKAWEILSKNNPSNIDLSYIIIYAPESWKVKAQKLLDERNK
jgi:hypothetical protein